MIHIYTNIRYILYSFSSRVGEGKLGCLRRKPVGSEDWEEGRWAEWKMQSVVKTGCQHGALQYVSDGRGRLLDIPLESIE